MQTVAHIDANFHRTGGNASLAVFEEFMPICPPRTALRIRFLLGAFALISPCAEAQVNRVIKAIDTGNRVILGGHLTPRARAAVDQGRVSPSLSLPYVTLTFARSEAQNAALAQLLLDQQNPQSSSYHHWLTPEEYGARFGLSDADLNAISSWLQSQGLTLYPVARSHAWIAVGGTAAQVERAFQTELHSYLAGGEAHFANATEPSIPAALNGIVKGVRGLHDFRMKPALRSHALPEQTTAQPMYNSSRSGLHYLAPDDFATIYNVAPLYAAGFDGSGLKLAVVGQTQIDVTDIQTFRSKFGLTASDPQVTLVPNAKDPGLSKGDLGEADLDLEWSGAVARGASLVYIYSSDVMDAVQYAIDQKVAPVLSSSYGLCEAESGTAEVLTLQTWAQQANAQGMTWFAASGDAGGADCDDSANPGLAVDAPASIPEVTGVGGTRLNEGSGSFWNAANGATGASATSYIPEVTWNDSIEDGSPSASGGGASIVFAKPSWQTGSGVPSDNARHVPDVALAASADHDGYLVYTNGQQQVFGGTSAPAPSFAGLAVLLSQYLVSKGVQPAAGLGNMNTELYALAASVPSAFHDTTSGDNLVTVNCPPRALNCSSNGVGFSAGPGYDMATGLGSVDAYQLVTHWTAGGSPPPPASSTAITLTSNISSVRTDDVALLIARVTDTSGITPAGTVLFSAGATPLGYATLTGSAGVATATLEVTGAQVASTPGAISAAYSGSSAITASVSLTTISSTNTTEPPVLSGVTNGASYQPAYAPGMILSVFGSSLALSTQEASSVPLPLSMTGVAATINGIAAPLYYVAPGQLNIQIPYEVPSGLAALTVNNNGHVSSRTFTVAAAAPGIFTDTTGALVPSSSAARGAIVSLYLTGAGAISPGLASGSAPLSTTAVAGLPKPAQNTTVTIGGSPAAIQFIGDSWGLVGVVQLNVQVPSSVPAGSQPVVVNVGGVASAPALLTITN